MKCSCREEVIANLKSRMAAKFPEAEITSVELNGYSVAMTNDRKAVMRLGTTADIQRLEKTRAGSMRTKKNKVTILFSYCPFCGEKAE